MRGLVVEVVADGPVAGVGLGSEQVGAVCCARQSGGSLGVAGVGKAGVAEIQPQASGGAPLGCSTCQPRTVAAPSSAGVLSGAARSLARRTAAPPGGGREQGFHRGLTFVLRRGGCIREEAREEHWDE